MNHRQVRHWSVWKNSSNKHCCYRGGTWGLCAHISLNGWAEISISKWCAILPFPWHPKKHWLCLSVYFPWKPQQAGTSHSAHLEMWFVKSGHWEHTVLKRHSGLLFTAPWSIWWTDLFLLVVAKETARNQEECKPRTSPLLGLTFPEGTTAKETISC